LTQLTSLTAKSNNVNLVNSVRSQCRQHRHSGQYRPNPASAVGGRSSNASLPWPPSGGNYLTALTVLTRLTVLTADKIDPVDLIDGEIQLFN
jgi:hypothetical protein